MSTIGSNSRNCLLYLETEEPLSDCSRQRAEGIHSRDRSVSNFLVNLLAGLVAYTYQEKKPALDLNLKGLSALPPAIF